MGLLVGPQLAVVAWEHLRVWDPPLRRKQEERINREVHTTPAAPWVVKGMVNSSNHHHKEIMHQEGTTPEAVTIDRARAVATTLTRTACHDPCIRLVPDGMEVVC